MFLNIDAGERDDEPRELWALADVLNCACGGHAGDAESIDRVASFCADARARLGAHPSYPDRVGFGRRSPLAGLPLEAFRPVEGREAPVLRSVRSAVSEQCATLREIATGRGVEVVAVKPHGALYHDAALNPVIAAIVLEAAAAVLGRGIVVLGPPGGALRDEAARLGLRYAREGFADRRLRADGSLVPREMADALVLDPAEAARQAVRLAPHVDTICVHADTPGALAIASAVRGALGG